MAQLEPGIIDDPIVDLVTGFNELPHCFTLQSCSGHFLWDDQRDLHSLAPLPALPAMGGTIVTYRIAYIAFCLDHGESGKNLCVALRQATAIDRHNIQFGWADWFWKQQINSVVLQVEPDRFRYEDTATIEPAEAHHLATTRDSFFARLRVVLDH
jgi:hypothetical protein